MARPERTPERTIARLIPGDRDVDSTRALVMGILNVTPDSFFDGGSYDTCDDALRHAERMAAEGADIIDIGGESTRPGAEGIPLQQELDRVIPVVERLRGSLDIRLSIDSVKPEVMQEAVNSGAGFINDINALRADGAMGVAVRSGLPVCLMHMQGTPVDMQESPEYDDVLGEVIQFLTERVDACLEAGISAENIVVDPGFGFGKRISHNLELLGDLNLICEPGYPVLVGLSRKSMIRKIVPDPVAGLHASVAMAIMAYMSGARIFRVHDVAPTVEALSVARAVARRRR